MFKTNVRKNISKRGISKRGVSIWISWVLLVAFMVSISTFMYYFMSDFTKKSIDDVKDRVIDSKVCDNVGITISICLKKTNDLSFSVKNVNYITVDKIAIDLFDVFDRPQQKSKEFKLVSGNTKTFDLLKDGIIKEVHIVPVVYKDGKTVFCSNKQVIVAPISDC
jgi:hypothetical protein